MTVTEHDLVHAVLELSSYVSDLPSKEEARAVKDEALKIFSEWIAQQNPSQEEGLALFNSLTAKGRIKDAGDRGFQRYIQRDRS
mgnify:CR=1 FL=1